MTTNIPANPISQPPLTIEQAPPDISIPVYTSSSKTKSPLSFLFNFLFFLFGIGGISYGMYMQLQITSLKQQSPKTSPKITISQTPLSPTKTPSKMVQQTTPSLASSSASTTETMIKETLCFTLSIPKKNDVGVENNCDISYRSYPDPNNPDAIVTISVYLNNKEYKNSQDMADQWLQLEKDRGSENVFIEKGPIQVGGLEGYKVITEYSNKAMQETHIFVYNPSKYEAYGYPITGFELLSGSDMDKRLIQQKELERLVTTWKWK